MSRFEGLHHSPLTLRPDPSRTVIRPFVPGNPAAFASERPRADRIVERILALDEAATRDEVAHMMALFDGRHRNVEALLLRRFEEVHAQSLCPDAQSTGRKLLIGAYFSEEYSFEAAALFNPSIVEDIDQSGVPAGCVRFSLSLRGIGEGHVSSVTFRTGIWGPGHEVVIDPVGPFAVPPEVAASDPDDEDGFTLVCEGAETLSETVLFPVVASQKQGIEDVRMVRFVEEDGAASYLGTYTAFSGSVVRSEMFEAHDFNRFKMRPMRGVIADGKGTALFPRRIGGRYAMLGRQDNESIWYLTSDSLTQWDEAVKIVSPRYPWEYVQMGNCGSPIEIDEGWLVLTHGVGAVRRYCIGACLLDRDDPTKLLARTPEPLLGPEQKERDGYVPNVVYSCGGLVHDRTLLLPYGVADGFTAFATIPVAGLLAGMA